VTGNACSVTVDRTLLARSILFVVLVSPKTVCNATCRRSVRRIRSGLLIIGFEFADGSQNRQTDTTDFATAKR
jgi:hypothetical protein